MVQGNVQPPLPEQEDMLILAELQKAWEQTGRPVTAPALAAKFPQYSVADMARKLEVLSRQHQCTKGAPSAFETRHGNHVKHFGASPQQQSGQNVKFRSHGAGFNHGGIEGLTGLDPRVTGGHENFANEHNIEPAVTEGLRYVPEKIVHVDVNKKKHVYCWDGHAYVNVSDFSVGHHVRLHGFQETSGLAKYNGQLAMVVRAREDNPNGKYTVVCEIINKEDGSSEKIPMDLDHEHMGPPWAGRTADEILKDHVSKKNQLQQEVDPDQFQQLLDPEVGFVDLGHALIPESRVINPDLPKVEGKQLSIKPWDLGWKFYMSYDDFHKYAKNHQQAQYFASHQPQFDAHFHGQGPLPEPTDPVDSTLDWIAGVFGLTEEQNAEFAEPSEEEVDPQLAEGTGFVGAHEFDATKPPQDAPDIGFDEFEGLDQELAQASAAAAPGSQGQWFAGAQEFFEDAAPDSPRDAEEPIERPPVEGSQAAAPSSMQPTYGSAGYDPRE